jgi:hypothetical protein
MRDGSKMRRDPGITPLNAAEGLGLIHQLHLIFWRRIWVILAGGFFICGKNLGTELEQHIYRLN